MIAFEYHVETFLSDSFAADITPLDELGGKGWELVAVVPCPEAFSPDKRRLGPVTMYFKRPLQAGASPVSQA